MDPIVGAAIAVGAAWLSIVIALALPWRPPVAGLRRAGGAALGVVALMVWGVPVPAWVPLVVLALGIAISLRRPRVAS
jgi:hypothetical protein